MKKLYYPAIFQKEDIGYTVWIYDISGCISEGDTFEEAVENINDALGLYFEESEDNNFKFPKPTEPTDIKLENGQFVAIIEFNSFEYLAKHSNKAVKKTLSIPSWLNTAAEERHINFSKVLQSALKDQLEIVDY